MNPSAEPSGEERARALIHELRRRGVDLRQENGRLLLTGPRGLIDERLQAELRARKHDILASLETGDETDTVPHLPNGMHPLSSMQQAMWYLESEQPELGIFNLFLAFDIRGSLDVDALQESLQQLLERHDALRITIAEHDGKPVQRIHPAPEVVLAPEPLDGTDEDELNARLSRETTRPFDVMEGPLYRWRLFRADTQRHVLLLVLDHLVADGTSLVILKRELVEMYAARLESREPRLETPRLRYVEAASEEQRWLNSQAAERQLAYWKQQLSGELPVLDLPGDYQRPALPSGRGECVSLELSRNTVTAIESAARAAGASSFMLMSATIAALLSGLGGQKEVLIGTPMANRRHPHSDNVVGLFINPVALRIGIDRGAPFTELLRTVRDRSLEALENQFIPFEKVVEALQLPRDPSRAPVFQALVIFLPGVDRKATVGWVAFEPINVRRGTAQTDVTFLCYERDDGMCVEMEYSADLFSPQTAQSMLDTFENMLAAVINDPSQPVASLPLLSDTDREQLASWGSGAERDWSATTVNTLVREQCARTPNEIAISSGEQQRDYATLAREASCVTSLLRERGIGRGDIVGVLLERDARLPAILLGVLDAGAAYLPIDPETPQARVQWMLEDAAAKLVISTVSSSAALKEFGGEVIDLSLSDLNEQSGVHEQEITPATPDDPAYVIYTSGSTGKPKGVVVPHRAVANFLRAMQELLRVDDRDHVMALTTLSFDIAVLELWLPLMSGARIGIVSREIAREGDALLEWVTREKPTVMQATPATWQLLLGAGWKGNANARLLSGGEALPTPLARELFSRSRELWNVYGPTETTVWSTAERVSEGDDPISIGRPIANTQVFVLDPSGQPTPPGVPGELCIGGEGVTLGYLNRPELTRERFIPDTVSRPVPGKNASGAMLYRTGDRVRFDLKGRLEYLGRVDFQIKLRGHRIEPGEIEAALEALPAVERAVVIVRQFDADGTDQRLVAYVTLQPGVRTSVDELREPLRQQLPAYMLPQHFVALDVMPLTPAGKINRKALPAPTAVRRRAHTPPVTSTEQSIARVWQEMLGVNEVGRDDNFFDLGGHSLSSMETVARIRKELGCRIRPRLLVLNTLAEIAAACDKLAGEQQEKIDAKPHAAARSNGGWRMVMNMLLGKA
ncbi:MAG TPA: amino acid adenylation domain-containing protein [Gammaproteobacteria bacterium]